MTISPVDLAAWTSALDSLEVESQADRWAKDPVAWVQERLGEHVWSKQAEIMRSVTTNHRTAVPSCNASGKSQVAAWIIAWFIDTNPPGDAFVFTTAPRAQQVRAVLWRYIQRTHRKANLPGVITRGQVPEWHINGELVGFGRSPAGNDADTVMGTHEKKLLIVIDEADGVEAALWHSLESLMTNDEDCYVLALANPVDNSSHFARICDGSERGWNVMRISAFDTPRLTGEYFPDDIPIVTKAWVEDKAERWGTSNPMYIAKVLGLHPDADDGLIPASWVVAANQRWLDWEEQFDGIHEPKGRKVFGVDVAWMGDDDTVIATRQGNIVMSLECFSKMDTTQTAGVVQARLNGSVQGVAVVDVNGVGAGVVDQLRRSGHNVRPFNGAWSAKKRQDSTGSWFFPNMRCYSWYNMREHLDPGLCASLALPPDDDLMADLVAPKYEPRAGAILWIEDKPSIRKRIHRSPDRGDAVALSLMAETLERADDADRPRARPKAYTNRGGSWA